MGIILQREDITSSRRMQGKRLLADYETCKTELKNETHLLFSTCEEALENANERLLAFPINSRSRTLEASIVQSCFTEVLFRSFGDKAFFGKYKRLILRVNGYLILFKKLNNKGLPMNIKTLNVQSILNQNQILDLFSESEYNDEPILYFGYQKDKIGQFVNPQLVYIDEGEIKFTIGIADMQLELPISKNEKQNGSKEIEVMPKLKTTSVLRKAN
jgi:hypothetical protein